MMDYTGMSTLLAGEAADRQKAVQAKAGGVNPPANTTAPSPFQIYQAPQQDYSTFQFKDTLTPPRLDLPQSPAQQVTPLGLLPANLTQMVNRIAGQIISFFKGNQKEKPTEEEKMNRQLNDAFGTGFMGEVLKVQEAAKGQMEDGEDS